MTKIFGLILGTLVGLVLLEVVVRYSLPAPKVYRFSLHDKKTSFQLSENPILGYEMKPNYRDPEANCHNSLPETNSFGLRDRERAIDAEPNVKRVLLLGDSVVAGHGQCNFEEIVSARLEGILNNSESNDRRIEVLNFGIGGYCTRAEIELLRVKGLQFKPDLVALVFVANDYVSSNGLLLAALQSPPPRLAARLFDNSHIFRHLVLQLNFLNLKDRFDPAAPMKVNQTAIGDNNVLTGLNELKALQAEFGFHVLIILWPYFTDTEIYEVGEEKFLGYKAVPDVQEIAEQNNFPIFSLAPIFKADLATYPQKRKGNRRGPSPRWSYTQGDGTHPSKKGAEIAAHAISEQIKLILD